VTEGVFIVLNNIKNILSMSTIRWVFNLSRMLIVVLIADLMAWYIVSEVNYVTVAAAIGFEIDNFMTYVIVSLLLTAIAVGAILLLVAVFFGGSIGLWASWTVLFLGITIVATAHLYGLMATSSVVLGTLFIVAGVCFLRSSASVQK